MQDYDFELTIGALEIYLDIPQYVPTYQIATGIGPSDFGFFERYAEKRLKSEASAVAHLRELDESDLEELRLSDPAILAFKLRFELGEVPKWYSGGFNVNGRQPNWSKWKFMDSWSLEEATCLSIGFEPEKMPEPNEWSRSASAALSFFWDRSEQIRRSDCYGAKRPDQVSPAGFVQWAVKRNLDIPVELGALFDATSGKRIPAMIGMIDARLHDSALKVILALLEVAYKYSGGSVGADESKDIANGLKKLDIHMDPKTIKQVLDRATGALSGFVEDQGKRDSEAG